MRYWNGTTWSELHSLPEGASTDDSPAADPHGSGPYETDALHTLLQPTQELPAVDIPNTGWYDTDDEHSPESTATVRVGPPTSSVWESDGATTDELLASLHLSQDPGPDATSLPMPAGAPLVRRVAAHVIDMVIASAVYLMVLLLSEGVSVGHLDFWRQLPGWSTARLPWAIGGGIIAWFGWDWFWTIRQGATPGKALARLRVVESSKSFSTRNPTGTVAALRSASRLFYGIPVVGTVIWLLGGLVSAGFINQDDPNRRSPLDMLAGTSVISDTRKRAPQRRIAALLLATSVFLLGGLTAVHHLAHRPPLDEANRVLTAISEGRLADATSSFSETCTVDRASFAAFFDRTTLADFDLDRADIEWSVPLFAEERERSEAVVSGSATLGGVEAGPRRVALLMVDDDGWKACRFLGEDAGS